MKEDRVGKGKKMEKKKERKRKRERNKKGGNQGGKSTPFKPLPLGGR